MNSISVSFIEYQKAVWYVMDCSSKWLKVYFIFCFAIVLFSAICDTLVIRRHCTELLQKSGIYAFLLNRVDRNVFIIILSVEGIARIDYSYLIFKHKK